MKPKKKTTGQDKNTKRKDHDRSPLVTETNPEGAQYEDKGPNSEGPKGKLVDGESTNDGRE